MPNQSAQSIKYTYTYLVGQHSRYSFPDGSKPLYWPWNQKADIDNSQDNSPEPQVEIESGANHDSPLDYSEEWPNRYV